MQIYQVTKFWSAMMKKRYLSQFVSGMFDSKCAPQYELNSFVAMATYWFPDLSNIKGISGHINLAFHFHMDGWNPLFKYGIIKLKYTTILKFDLPCIKSICNTVQVT